jgi:hypothetical protein
LDKNSTREVNRPPRFQQTQLSKSHYIFLNRFQITAQGMTSAGIVAALISMQVRK